MDIVKRLQTRNGRADVFGLGPVCDEAADEIARLRAEVERLTDADAFSRKELRRGNEIIEKLRDENEALRADAERWRWLRQQGGWPDSEAAVSGYTPREFDKMADAALAAAGRE